VDGVSVECLAFVLFGKCIKYCSVFASRIIDTKNNFSFLYNVHKFKSIRLSKTNRDKNTFISITKI
jgi:hypothetical protein